jgi:MYXO-CTERM domain-containing protein
LPDGNWPIPKLALKLHLFSVAFPILNKVNVIFSQKATWMKVLLGMFVVMLFAGVSTCRADSYLSVNMLPTTFELQPDRPGVSASETVGATFTWDVTTGVLSDFQVTAQGPWAVGMFSPGFIRVDSTAIRFIDLVDAAGNIFQFNPGNHAGLIPPLPPIPGTYRTDLFFGCASHCGDDFKIGTAIVTPATEPATGLFVGLGLAVVALMRRRRKKSLDNTVWEKLG